MSGALAPVQDGDGDTVDQTGALVSQHVLQIGEKSFKCGPRLPMGTFLKYAESSGDLVVFHHLLNKLVVLEETQTMDDVWDACDEVEQEDVFKSIGELIASYTDRPSGSASDSSTGGKRTRRK